MKILSLKFMNLNSLYGEWSIDFTRPEYADNGLFAIVGPTGAGKSTIMDAISLALYGETPRLGKITSSGNEILSRQTGECYAEVVFESQSGRYRCQWRQHRARKRPDGKLAEASHEISDAITGKLLENKKRDVATAIEEKTGMNFERFTRSILLAQGSFAAFLKASPDERSPILEQITGTEIYSDISIAVHERQRAERQSLERLQDQIQGVSILSEAEEAQLAADLAQFGQQAADVAEQQKQHAAGLAWHETLARLEQELTTLAGEKDQLDRENQAAEPQRQTLATALRAQPLDSAYASLDILRREQQKDQHTLAELEQHRPDLEQKAAVRTAAHAQVEQDLQAAQAALTAIQPVLLSTRQLDWNIHNQSTTATRLEDQAKQQTIQIDQVGQDLEHEQSSLATALADQTMLNETLARTAADEPLVTQIAGITAQFGQIKATLEEVQSREQARNDSQAASDLQATISSKAGQALARFTEQIQQEQTVLDQHKAHLQAHLKDRSLGDYRTELAALQKEARLVRTIIDLETERKRLADGQPCPLCGSLDHPYAAGNLPEMDAIEQAIEQLTGFIAQADAISQQITDQMTQVSTVQQTLAAAERKAQAAKADWELLKARIEQQTKDLAAQQDRLHRQIQAAQDLVTPYGITDLSVPVLDDVLQSLQLRSLERQRLTAEQLEMSTQIEQARHRIDLLEQRLITLTQGRQQSAADLDQVQQDLAAARTARQELFGAKNPDAEEVLLQAAIQTAVEAEKQARAEAAEHARILQANQSARQTLSEQLHERQQRLAELETSWTAHLAEARFASEADYLTCRLPAADLSSLQSQIQTLDQKRSDLATRIEDRTRQKAQALAEPHTPHNREFLAEEQAQLDTRQKEIQQKIGERLARQTDNQAAKERTAAIRDQLDKQQAECRTWDRLQLLIGSSDGKKYRNFAQGLTFERMVAQANQQLMQMTDRYLLVRDTEQPLNLNVIDNYQAGETRTTRNLSGGESFLVSLALALGLSRMASRKIRVDSLFLDEGFGTLDDEALETALETLSTLQAENKLIGVISHVPALKERISTQIRIQAQAGGKSTISGPGVERIHPLA